MSTYNKGPKLIMFNGPKGSGKDEAVRWCQDWVLDSTSKHVKMAHPLYYSIQEMFGLDDERWNRLYNDCKEVPRSELYGMTPRQALIWLSEEVVKPKFGSDFFGQIAGKTSLEFFDEEPSGVVLMSDAGFNDEVGALVERVGSDRSFLVRLCNGSDFSGDSREYVHPDQVGILPTNFFTIYNTGSLAEFRENVKLVVKLIETKRTPIL